MYKIKHIENNAIYNEQVFNRYLYVTSDGSSTVKKVFDSDCLLGDALEIGKEYDMKLGMLGTLIDDCSQKQIGENLEFEIIKEVKIGVKKFLEIQTVIGNFYVQKEVFKDIGVSKLSKNVINYTRVDLLSIDGELRFDLKF